MDDFGGRTGETDGSFCAGAFTSFSTALLILVFVLFAALFLIFFFVGFELAPETAFAEASDNCNGRGRSLLAQSI